MKIHHTILFLSVAFLAIFSTAYAYANNLSAAYIIGLGVFGLVNCIATAIAIDNHDGSYYKINLPFKKDKSKEQIRGVLLEKMKEADGYKLDELIKRLEDL